MALFSPARADQSYRHEAFFWRHQADFTDSLVPFVREGLEAGEPVMAALAPEHIEWLRDELQQQADDVVFVDMHELGRTPARIIPAWNAFLDAHSGRRKPVRGIGEPIWPERSPDEVAECQLTEALLNVAIDPELPFWLVCPYDAGQLAPVVVEEAHRSHPVIVETDSYQGSARYGGRAHVESLFNSPLPGLSGQPREIAFDASGLDRVFSYVALEAYVAGLPVGQATDLATAARGLAISSLDRGSGAGRIRVWDQPEAVICEVVDALEVDDLLLGRRAPLADRHDGLWFAHQLCDLVQLRSAPTGTTVRAQTWKPRWAQHEAATAAGG